MKSSSVLTATILAGAGASFALLSACHGPPPIFVHPGRLGQPTEVDIGENVDVARIAKPMLAGLPAGWYMIRSEEDWALLFADFPNRPLPPRVDFNHTMVLGGYSGSSEVTSLQVTKVIQSADAIHVYTMQTGAGDGCPRLKGPLPFDMVSLPRSDKPIHIHADTERGVSCDGGGPKGGVVCRSASSPKWAARASAQLGDQVECQAQNEAWGSSIVDQSVMMSEIPKGSAAKLTFDSSGMRVRFPVDSLGRYVVRLELTEDQGRKGGGSAVVDAVPPTRDTYVELFWTKFDGSDDPSTFPRVELHALEMPTNNGKATWVDCFGDAKERPAWCELETHGANTLMRLHADPPGRFAIGARYIDDRFQGAPVLCVRTFKNAALMRETCDPTVRRAGSYWQAGVLAEATGTFEAPVVDGGAPSDSGAATGPDAH